MEYFTREQASKTHNELLNRYAQPSHIEHMNFENTYMERLAAATYPPETYGKIAREGFYGAFRKYTNGDDILGEWHELALVFASILRNAVGFS